MRKILLLSALSLTSGMLFAQTQIGNSDLENWESVSSGEEPVNWNSFMTATGGFSGFADVQIEQSADVRPGTSGTKSARIWSRDAGFGITANGNMTLGIINMGAIQASSPNNFNFTDRTDADFSEAFTDSPDSIVFWAKFNANGASEEARMKATIHDDYDYRDPEDAAAASHVVDSAFINFLPTAGWVRMSVPFNAPGPGTGPEYILVTFTTNRIPGGGDPNDELFIDDIELIYNNNGIAQNDVLPLKVFMNNTSNALNFDSEETIEGEYTVIDMAGKQIQTGNIAPSVSFNVPTGVYLVNVLVGDKMNQFKVFKN